MKKLLFVTSCPSPYRVKFFDALGEDAEVTVLYSDRKDQQTHRNAQWFASGKGNFKSVQLQKHVVTMRKSDLCMDVIPWLRKPFDAIVISGYAAPTATFAILYLRMKKIPFYIEVDGCLIRESTGFKYRFKKYLVSSASGWFSSGASVTDCLVHYGARREAVYEYPFSSLTESDIQQDLPSAEEKASLRAELGMQEEKILLAVGQFVHRKGFDILMQTAAGLPETVGVYIVGGLPTEEYTRLHQQLGLSHVHFAGFQNKESLERYYRAADLFVMPTREDIWGLVINEAMAFGLPVITTDRCVAGVELVEDGISGYIVPVEDAEILQQKILQALDADLQTMGSAALAAVRPYTIENMARRHMEILG